MSAPPYLSIVLTGRNDGYGSDFVGRFLRTLRFNHAQLTAHGVDYEFVFVEWAPPADTPRLLDLVFDAVPDLRPAQCAWYVVDGTYQRALSLNPHLAYLEFIAKNVGVRRARGTYVLTTNCDVFLGRRVIEAMATRSLEPRVLYRAVRHDLKLGAAYDALSWDVLEDERNLDGRVKPLKPPFMGRGTGDFILLDRDTYHALRGFNEVYRVARFGIDFNFLVKAYCERVSIRDIGGPVYHVNHVGSFRLNARMYAGRESEAHYGRSGWPSRTITYANPLTWGLAASPIHEIGPNAWLLPFSWDAVPRMIDLDAVVRPGVEMGLVRD